MSNNDKKFLKVIAEIALSLCSLVAGIVCIGLGTNLYIALGVFFLIVYYNSTRGDE